MQPNKPKKTSKKEEPLFTEDERVNVPFIKAVANKLRNIHKKLLDITELEAKPADQLKPEQKEKLSKKQSLLDQTAKFQEMIKLYRSIEIEKKDNDRTEADKTLHLQALVRVLIENPESLFEKKLLGRDEAILFEPLVGLHHKTTSMKEHLGQAKQFVRDYLKNEGLQAIVEKTVAHKDFGALPVGHYIHHEEKHPSKAKGKSSKKDEKESAAKPEKVTTVVVEEPVVKVQKIQPKEEVVAAVPNPSSEAASVSATTGVPASTVTVPAKIPSSEVQATSETQPAENRGGSQNSSERGNRRPYDNNRNRGHNRYPVAHRDSIQQGRFTKEERAKLDEQGFIVVQKPQKVASRHSTKQFGPRRDNRQYHQ